MLPDMPTVRDYGQQWLMYHFFSNITKNTSFMQAMRQPEMLKEGNKTKLLRYDGTIDDVPMKSIGTKIEIKVNDLDKHGLKEVLKVLDRLHRIGVRYDPGSSPSQRSCHRLTIAANRKAVNHYLYFKGWPLCLPNNSRCVKDLGMTVPLVPDTFNSPGADAKFIS